MKRRFLKAPAIALCIAMTLAVLSGCGPAEKKITSKDAYEAFLGDSMKAVSGISFCNVEEGDELSFEELVKNMLAYFEEDFEDTYIGDISYGYIDCGLDGEPELLLNCEYCEVYTLEDADPYSMPFYEYLILKYFDDGLRIVDIEETYYRYETNISYSGIINYGGSNSAFSHGGDISYADKDGAIHNIYSYDYTVGYADPFIPTYSLPSDIIPEDYPYSEDYSDNGYEIDTYNFSEHDYSDEGWEEYKKGNFFAILDQDSEPADVSQEIKDYYESLGIKVYYDEDDVIDVLMDRVSDLGLDEIFYDETEIEWTLCENDWLPKG